MKDAVHHLKRVQKKVIQEIRKSSGGSKPFIKEVPKNNNHVPAEDGFNYLRVEKRADTNHRVPRLRYNRSMIH